MLVVLIFLHYYYYIIRWNQFKFEFENTYYSSIIQIVRLCTFSYSTRSSFRALSYIFTGLYDISFSVRPLGVFFFSRNDYSFNSMFVFLTIFGSPLGVTLGWQCPGSVWVIDITILFESVLVVFELLLESLDRLLMLNEDVLKLLPLFVNLHVGVVQHSVLLFQVMILLRVHLLVVADLLFQRFILFFEVGCLFLVLEVFLWPRSAAGRSDWLLGFWKSHLPNALLSAVVIAVR